MVITDLKNKYKDRKPEETIKFIKDFFEEKGFSFEIEYLQSFENIHSCKIRLLYNGEVIHRSFGKGTTKEFAEASGLAEMIERVLSKEIKGASYITQQNIKRNKPFYIAKDEKIFSYDEIKNTKFKMLEMYKSGISEKKYKDILYSYYDFIENNQRKYICLPFKNIFTNEIEYTPYHIYERLIGSTGLASGNTFEEAMVQAISEIIEREVMVEVGTKKFNTPIISNEDIRHINIDLYNIIKEIEKDGNHKIIIKETSLGKGYPTISVILYNKNTSGYYINTGTAPTFEIALERCLTELYQFDTKETVDKRTTFYKLKRKREEDFTHQDFFGLIASCTNYNDSFFLTNNKKYSLSHFSKDSTNKEFLNYYKKLLKTNGYEIFYREIKLKGFSVVRVCVPYMKGTPDLKIEYLHKNKKIYNNETDTASKFNQIISSNRNNIHILFSGMINDRVINEYTDIVKNLLKNNYSQETITACLRIEEELNRAYFNLDFKKHENSFEIIFSNLLQTISTINTFFSFYKHHEENLLLMQNPFIDKKSQELIKALIEHNKEKLEKILLDENLLVNKNLEKEMVNAFDKIFYEKDILSN